MSEKFQAVVIGGGPGGYFCAIILSKLEDRAPVSNKKHNLFVICLVIYN